MRFTQYFLYTRQRKDRIRIKHEWIEQVVNNPEKSVTQKDGRIRKWAYIDEARKHLRVILLDDGLTVHNAFFDRSFKGSDDEN